MPSSVGCREFRYGLVCLFGAALAVIFAPAPRFLCCDDLILLRYSQDTPLFPSVVMIVDCDLHDWIFLSVVSRFSHVVRR